MKIQFHRPWLAVAVLAGTGSLCAAGAWDTLLRNSPFGAGAPTAAAAMTPAGGLEFCGYFVEGGEPFFSIYDPARKRSFWLRPDETSGGLTARRFDAGRQVLSVEFQGSTLSLPLKQATLRASPPTAVPAATLAATPAPGNVVAGPDPGAGAVGEVAVAEKRLAEARQRQAAIEDRVRIAAERRRQLQMQAAHNP